jgi:hypothetical protein
MTDTNVTELRPSPAKGDVPSRAAIKQRRYRKRKKAVTAGVTPRVTATPKIAKQAEAVTAIPRHAGKAVDVPAYIAAIGLASVAALFSIRGMVVLFPGSPMSVVGMAVAMEGAKLVTAGWLARRWRATAWVWRLVLVALVAGLAIINATGVYAQLVAAHVGLKSQAVTSNETQDAALAARVAVQTHNVADLDARVSQIDAAIAEATKRGRTNAALSAMEGQKKTRGALAGERNEAAGILAALQTERASVAAKGRQIETEAAPIRYVAELLGADTDSERAIRWLILMMVLCCDPLAIALTAAASARQSTA